MHRTLTELGHDVLSALESAPRATDKELLALAIEQQRVLITEDKDFGELVFVRRLPHPCIIRFVGMSVAEHAARGATTEPLVGDRKGPAYLGHATALLGGYLRRTSGDELQRGVGFGGLAPVEYPRLPTVRVRGQL